MVYLMKFCLAPFPSSKWAETPFRCRYFVFLKQDQDLIRGRAVAVNSTQNICNTMSDYIRILKLYCGIKLDIFFLIWYCKPVYNGQLLKHHSQKATLFRNTLTLGNVKFILTLPNWIGAHILLYWPNAGKFSQSDNLAYP